MAEQARTNYEEAPLLPLHKKVTLGVYLGQISDGYTLCVVGTALTLATTHLNLTSFWMGAIGAGALLGILFGSLCLGPLSDKFGRKPLFILSMLCFSIVTAIQFFITDPLMLVISRFMIGVCIGMDYTSSPSLLTEWVPRRLSPRLLSSFLILWMTGFVFAYIIGIVMPDFGENTWRWILVSPLLPSTLAFLWRLCSGIPESPRWLESKGRAEEGQELIRKHLGPEYYMPTHAEAGEDEKTSTSWFQLFSKDQWRASMTAGIFTQPKCFPFSGLEFS
ncbi:MFS transporter, partial [Desulfovibrio sp. OttesenSCG-928-G15]|nr:MFS transporter [Desulfovibrio sp. OttesenSCG-928-G15]